MAGGKKAKRGGTAKKKQLSNASLPTERNTAFIETHGESKRVLPREIRDTIYRYLLLGSNVKKQRNRELWDTKGLADYYCFDVSILRVNRAIHTETRNVLYGENIFIVLSFKEREFSFRLKYHAVPIISEHFSAVDRFSEHSLYMRFEGPHRADPEGRKCSCNNCRAPAPEERRLLLSDDLPAFIRICRVINHMDPDPTFNLIDSPRNDTFSYRRLTETRKPSTTSIRFQNNTYGSPTPDFVEGTLTQLRKVAGDRQVEIVAPSHPWLSAECKEAMMPKVVWSYAIGWDLVEVARELKMAADEVVKACSPQRCCMTNLAMKLYERLQLLLCNSMIFRQLGHAGLAFTYTQKYCKSDTNGCWCLDWLESSTLLNVDLSIASVGLSLLQGSDECAEDHISQAFDFMTQSSSVPVDTKARFHHMMAFIDARHGMCREALADLKAAQTLRQMARLEPDVGLEQDIEQQVKHVKTCSLNYRSLEDEQTCTCRVSFAGKPWETEDSRFNGCKPAGLFAWQDFDHQLTEQNLKAMGLTWKDVPPRVHTSAEAPLDLVDQLEAMDLSLG